MAKYTPPRQSKIGQIIDVLVLLVLTVGALYIPLWMGLAGGAKVPAPFNPDATWESLGQNPAMVKQWEALGQFNAVVADPKNEALQAMITSRYDYWAFSNWELILMIVVVLGYYIIVVRLSGKEYKDVIAEKFGDRR